MGASNRFLEPGWRSAAMHDPSGRRGIWFRKAPDSFEVSPNTIELCGGREGDDAYVKLEVGQVLTKKDLAQIEEVLDRSRWMLEDEELEVVRLRSGVRFLDEDTAARSLEGREPK